MGKKNILITGASGNIGIEIIRGLKEIESPHHIIACGNSAEKSKKVLSSFGEMEFRKLDFADVSIFKNVNLVLPLIPASDKNIRTRFLNLCMPPVLRS
jgi:nucleoside-diphosphate-sugar epimerase